MLTETSFTWVSDLVRRDSAIVLERGKEYLVEARLLPLARAAGDADVTAYVARVRSRGSMGERAAVVEALTTNETSWFRDREPFDVLLKHVLPELLAAANPTRTLRIWSAACSSGQEAYTIAMLLSDHLPPGWSLEILATDLSTAMLERVQAGRYSQLEVGRGLPAPMMVRHFTRSGTDWQVSEKLRSMVTTRSLNLATAFPPLPVFDVVFLRNVLIYFDAATKRSVLGRVRAVTRPGGYLFLGAAETTLGVDETWRRVPVGRFAINQNPGPVTVATTAVPTPTYVPVAAGVGAGQER